MRLFLASLLAFSLAVNLALLAWLWRAEPQTVVRDSSVSPVVMRTAGGLLEVSTVRTEERFHATTTHTILDVPVVKPVAQIRVPAVYRYHIALAKKWELRLSGQALMVVAPKVQASTPVAIDTAKLEAFSAGFWSPFTGQPAIDRLQQSITATLTAKAEQPDMIALQREAARKTVTEFVQKWVLQQDRWRGQRVPAILVFFVDEPLGQGAQPLFSDAPSSP